MRKKIHVVFVGVAALICMLVALLYSSEQHTFVETLSKGDIMVEGELVFRGSNKVTVSHVRKEIGRDEWLIEYPDKSFLKRGGQFYIDDGRGNEKIDISINGVREIEEMFDRVSAFSGFAPSELEFISRYSAKIPELSSENQVECICEEYRKKAAKNPM